MSGIKVRSSATGETLGWVAVDPSGNVRLAGFSESLGTLMPHPVGWCIRNDDGGVTPFTTRKAALERLWMRREWRLQTTGH